MDYREIVSNATARRGPTYQERNARSRAVFFD
jgi:hypothetical protein